MSITRKGLKPAIHSLLLACPLSVSAQTVTWTGGGGSTDAYWDVSSNWSPTTPGTTNAVVIGDVTTTFRTNTVTISSLQDEGELLLTGGQLNLTLPSSIASLSVSGGALSAGFWTTVTGSSIFTGGAINGGTLNLLGATSITGGGTTFSSGTINTSGTTTWSGNTAANGNAITFYAATLNNTGTWLDENAYSTSLTNCCTTTGSLFNNLGTYTKTGVGTTSANNTDGYGGSVGFDNSGAVNVDAGTLNLNNGGTSRGTFDIAKGATLGFSGGTYGINGGTVTGPGTLLVNGATVEQSLNTTEAGTLNVQSGYLAANGTWNAAALNISGGTLGGSGTTTITGTATITGGTIGGGTTNLQGATSITGGGTTFSSGTINTSGTTTWSGNTAANGNAITFYAATLNNTGTWLDENAYSTSLTNCCTTTGSLFNNLGTYTKTGVGTTSANNTDGYGGSVGFNNSGTVNINNGTLFLPNLTNLTGTTLIGGIFNIASTLEISGNVTEDASNISLTGKNASIINSSTGTSALASLQIIAPTGRFSIANGANFSTNAQFFNAGTLAVGATSTFSAGPSFLNFAGTTLSTGTYDLVGTLEFAGANIETNAANLTLSGTASRLLNSTTGGTASRYSPSMHHPVPLRYRGIEISRRRVPSRTTVRCQSALAAVS